MLAHGISTGALFLLVGFLYERRHSLEIASYGGVSTPAPWLATAFMVTMLASIGLPMLCNFIGEYLVLQGTSLINFRWTVFAALGAILAACYMLWLYQRVFFGKASEDLTHHMPDLQLPRVRHHCSPDRFDGLDGHLHAEFPSADFRIERRAAGAHRRAPRDSCASQRHREARQRFSQPKGSWSMPVNFMPTGTDYFRILPEIIMTVGGTLIMLIEGWLGENKKRNLSALTFVAFAAALVAAVAANGSPGLSFSNMLIVDGFATFFRVLVIGVGILSLLSAVQYLKREHCRIVRILRAAAFLGHRPMHHGHGQ